jgi:urease accessory protein
MTMITDTRLVRLLQLASPALPVGAFSYSQGLEAAVEAGLVHDRASAEAWIGDCLSLTIACMEAPVLARLIDAWRADGADQVNEWNEFFLASRETAELRAETAQMGYSLAKLLTELGEGNPAASLATIAFPTAFAYAVSRWQIESEPALIAYLWSWLENQVIAAVKAVPLGQTDAQRLLIALGDLLPAQAAAALQRDDDDLCNFAPGLAILSAQHETQYSRLFRS